MMNVNGKNSKKWKIILAIVVLVLVLAMILGPVIAGLVSSAY